MYNYLFSLRYTSWRWVNIFIIQQYAVQRKQQLSGCSGLDAFKQIAIASKCNTVSNVKDITLCHSGTVRYLLFTGAVMRFQNQIPKINVNCFMNNTGLYEYMIQYNYWIEIKVSQPLSSQCIAIAHHTKGRQFQQSSGKWKHTKYCFAQFIVY
ncbi:Hypothetical_protein [Hexamita inflata]|uniref:Hypothetical_protein n=1 Tax=Hexamita inflata TaxID=28002 RepID=A0AA86N4L0_9EUKA|nr:Hypothetical protein HINF_LOCUS260 [Hexamita inflata]